jgi:hypothetical protein
VFASARGKNMKRLVFFLGVVLCAFLVSAEVDNPFCYFAVPSSLHDFCVNGGFGDADASALSQSNVFDFHLSALVLDDTQAPSLFIDTTLDGAIGTVLSYDDTAVLALPDTVPGTTIAMADVVNKVTARAMAPPVQQGTKYVVFRYGYYSAVDGSGNRDWQRFDYTPASGVDFVDFFPILDVEKEENSFWYDITSSNIQEGDIAVSYTIDISEAARTRVGIPNDELTILTGTANDPANLHVLSFMCSCQEGSCADQSTWVCNPRYTDVNGNPNTYGSGDTRYMMQMVGNIQTVIGEVDEGVEALSVPTGIFFEDIIGLFDFESSAVDELGFKIFDEDGAYTIPDRAYLAYYNPTGLVAQHEVAVAVFDTLDVQYGLMRGLWAQDFVGVTNLDVLKKADESGVMHTVYAIDIPESDASTGLYDFVLWSSGDKVISVGAVDLDSDFSDDVLVAKYLSLYPSDVTRNNCLGTNKLICFNAHVTSTGVDLSLVNNLGVDVTDVSVSFVSASCSQSAEADGDDTWTSGMQLDSNLNGNIHFDCTFTGDFFNDDFVITYTDNGVQQTAFGFIQWELETFPPVFFENNIGLFDFGSTEFDDAGMLVFDDFWTYTSPDRGYLAHYQPSGTTAQHEVAIVEYDNLNVQHGLVESLIAQTILGYYDLFVEQKIDEAGVMHDVYTIDLLNSDELDGLPDFTIWSSENKIVSVGAVGHDIDDDEIIAKYLSMYPSDFVRDHCRFVDGLNCSADVTPTGVNFMLQNNLGIDITDVEVNFYNYQCSSAEADGDDDVADGMVLDSDGDGMIHFDCPTGVEGALFTDSLDISYNDGNAQYAYAYVQSIIETAVLVPQCVDGSSRLFNCDLLGNCDRELCENGEWVFQ